MIVRDVNAENHGELRKKAERDNKMGWIKEALHQGQLKITENNNCPFCNPEHRIDVPTKINACEEHKWVSKIWYENRFKKNIEG